jgi:uncharacterized metal-binding protein YceD (DUF177 family)
MSPAPEFSRPVQVSRLDGAPIIREIAANEAERAALVERFGLNQLSSLTATVRLSRHGRDDVRLDAEMHAVLEQPCVVTLTPIPVELEEGFSLIYRPGIDDDEADRLAFENPEDEVIEPLAGDFIDIGEAVAQQLSLALDPYPRADGMALPIEIEELVLDEAEPVKPSPFAVLAGLKKPE